MRYQRSFPNVIPHAKVGCSRVTHPSATKLSSSKLSNNSVRLECVMHAASVHPEPGSNSRINCIKITFRCSNPFELSFQLLLLLFEQYFSFRISNEISFALYFCFRFVLLQSLVVQFSMTNSLLYQNIQLYQYITNYCGLSSTFLHFFELFSCSFARSAFATLLY